MKPEKCKALFETVYKPGTLTAIGRCNGKETGRDTLLTASENVHIETIDRGGGITEISVVDENGVLNPSVVLTISASTDDNMTILGFGTADPRSEENFFDRTIKTYRGRAVIVTRGEGILRIEEN